MQSADIVFLRLKPMFIFWSDAVGRLASGENFDDLHSRRHFHSKLSTKLNPLPTSSNNSASVSSASFGACDYRYSQEASDNVGLTSSSEQLGKNKKLKTKEFSRTKNVSASTRKLTATSVDSVSLTKSKTKIKAKAAKVPFEKIKCCFSFKSKQEKQFRKLTRKATFLRVLIKVID